jgi:prepilin-type processing-associated H-X9-DG protein/prepilin-type N-terminal cleavage/methylation domain-containing protein
MKHKGLMTGFTLIELLVAVTIVALLVALLVPAASSVWQAALATQCRLNLGKLWQAEGIWRADKQAGAFTPGGFWPGMLALYTEQDRGIFKCPAAPPRPDWTIPDEAAGAAGDGADTSDGFGQTGAGAKPGGFTVHDLTFRIYAKLSFKPYTAGQYLGTAFIDADYGVRKEDLGRDKWYYGIDDRSFFTVAPTGPSTFLSSRNVTAENLDYADIRFTLTMSGQRIKSIEFVGSDEITGQTSWQAFRFEMWLSNEMVSSDFVRDRGLVLRLDEDERFNKPPPDGSASAGTGDGAGQAPVAATLLCIKSFDYGLSKGTYEVEGTRVWGVDPAKILILDYCKSVADYASGNPDVWDLYFEDDDAAWAAAHSGELREGETREHYRALRHFGKANVLFCDGHVEALSRDELGPLEPLWRCGAR